MASFDNSRTLCLWCIVHHCCIVAVSNDSSEAVTFKVIALFTEGMKFFGCLVFGDGFAVFQCLKQPCIEFCFCNTILQVCFICILGFYLIFEGFHQFNRVICRNNTQVFVVLYNVIEAVIELFLITQNAQILLHIFQISKDIFVWTHGNAVFGQNTQNAVIYSCCVGKQDCIFLRNISISNCNWCACNVISTDVVQPCNTIQSIYYDCICFFFTQFFS